MINEEIKLWLFDLAHGNLTDDVIVKGFIKYYALQGLTIGNVQDNIHFHTMYYGDDNCRRAMSDLRRALEEYAVDTDSAAEKRCVIKENVKEKISRT